MPRLKMTARTVPEIVLGTNKFGKKYFGDLVSADGLEPSTHALKGHCSAN